MKKQWMIILLSICICAILTGCNNLYNSEKNTFPNTENFAEQEEPQDGLQEEVLYIPESEPQTMETQDVPQSVEKFEASMTRREALDLIYEFVNRDRNDIIDLKFRDDEDFYGYEYGFWDDEQNEKEDAAGWIREDAAIVNGRYLMYSAGKKYPIDSRLYHSDIDIYAVDLATGEVIPELIWPEDSPVPEINEAYSQIHQREYDLVFAREEVQSFAGIWEVTEYIGEADGEPITEEKTKIIERYKQQYLQGTIRVERDEVTYCAIWDDEHFDRYKMPEPLCGPYKGISISLKEYGYVDWLDIFRDRNGQVVLLVGTQSCFRLEKAE